jgi:hypothetical protein
VVWGRSFPAFVTKTTQCGRDVDVAANTYPTRVITSSSYDVRST